MSNFWKIFISVIVTVIIVGGEVYYLMQKQIDSIRSDNQSKMNELDDQLKGLQSSDTTTSTDETADWKTYTNTDYKFSFKYPSDWTLNSNDEKAVTVNSPENQAAKQKVDSGEMNGEGYMSDITFYSYNSLSEADGNNPKKWTNISDMISDKGYFPNGLIKTSLTGQTAYEGIEGGFGQYYIYVLQKDSKIFKVLFGNVETKDKLTLIDKKILSTFQFTK